MIKQFRFAAVPSIAGTMIVGTMIAGAMIVVTPAAAFAFSQQTVSPNGNYDFNYGPLDDKAKLNESKAASDPNSPGLHFSIGSGQTDRFGFHDSGDDSKAGPPDYSRPLGNGD
jgi:hypothetical protein